MRSKIMTWLVLYGMIFGSAASVRADGFRYGMSYPGINRGKIVGGTFVLLGGVGIVAFGWWLSTKTTDPLGNNNLERPAAPGYSGLGGVARYLFLPLGVTMTTSGSLLIYAGTR